MLEFASCRESKELCVTYVTIDRSGFSSLPTSEQKARILVVGADVVMLGFAPIGAHLIKLRNSSLRVVVVGCRDQRVDDRRVVVSRVTRSLFPSFSCAPRLSSCSIAFFAVVTPLRLSVVGASVSLQLVRCRTLSRSRGRQTQHVTRRRWRTSVRRSSRARITRIRDSNDRRRPRRCPVAVALCTRHRLSPRRVPVEAS